VIQPFIVAFFIAFIINPIVKTLAENVFYKSFRIKSIKICLAFGILTAYLLIIGLITGFCIYVIPQISDSIAKLSSQSSELYDELYKFLNTLETRTELNFTWIEDKLKETSPELITLGTDIVTNLLPKLLDFSISIVKLVINILLSIAISIYMLYDKRALSRNTTRILYAFIPKKKAATFLRLSRECGNIFTQFIVGKTIDSTIIGILCFIIMSVLRLDYAVLLSVIVGVTNMIPYFGPFIGAVPGLFLYLCIDPVQAVIFAIMILILQQIDGWIIGPKILGDSTGLTPLWVIFGITVGGAYGGVFGMFLGVPVVAVLAYLANLFINRRLEKKHLDIE
jgi:predicted PurR-regulated permease PerM